MSRFSLLRISVCTVLLAALVLIFRRSSPVSELETLIHSDETTVELDHATEQKIVDFCSACHVMPVPDSFARDAWHEEVMQGFHFYAKSGRTDLNPPTPQQAITYFRTRANDLVTLPEQRHSEQKSSILFRPQPVPYDTSTGVPPGVAHLKWLPGMSETSGLLAVCDMRLGTVRGFDPGSMRFTRAVQGHIGHPCHAEPCDLDNDGITDLVVADLGSFDPDDHDRGRVLWLRGDHSGQWTPQSLAQHLGRIADVRPVDLDGDGDLDLVVAEFGWHSTGGILDLRNISAPGAPPEFRMNRIYQRPGTIHVPCHDMDGDGLPDIVALVSQEHERVELLLNRSNQPWEVHTLWAAPDPAFGMSGLELVDLDQDGDLDILFTNGDTFDSMSLKPNHGIQWLRNDGANEFHYQRIADLSGAYRAIPADFDSDGDLDLIASVWMPRQAHFASDKQIAALVIFEQVRPLHFERHVLQSGLPSYATVEVNDFDGDGDTDFVVGSHLSTLAKSNDHMIVWWNETPVATTQASRTPMKLQTQKSMKYDRGRVQEVITGTGGS